MRQIRFLTGALPRAPLGGFPFPTPRRLRRLILDVYDASPLVMGELALRT